MNKKQKKNLQRIIIALILVLILKLLPQFPTPVELVLYCIPYLVVGWDVLRKALLGIKNRQPFDECFLMAVATVGAFALGDYVEGCAVIIFYQIGELFQSVAVGKSRQSISSLMDIRPDYANIEKDGKLEQVDPDEVAVGKFFCHADGIFSFAATKFQNYGVVVLEKLCVPLSFQWKRPFLQFCEWILEHVGECFHLPEFLQFIFAHNVFIVCLFL